MSSPFIGEVRMVGFNYPPKGWAFCDGQSLSIQQNAALFSILGTTYGGNGTTTFNLPDLRGRVAVHPGNNIALGQVGGEATHTLNIGEMAAHSHALMGGVAPQDNNRAPANNYLGSSTATSLYAATTDGSSLNPATIGVSGQSQPHANMQPYLAVPFCIALVGIFPSRN
ncbi:MAG TPA: tail fiber protein [Gemmataceae bacterium]|nr:tail fiber protein [Gemmataceae bacterium]